MPFRHLPMMRAAASLLLLAVARADDVNSTLPGAAVDDVEPSDLLAAASSSGNETDDRGAVDIAVDEGGHPANETDDATGEMTDGESPSVIGGGNATDENTVNNQTALNEILVKAAVAGVKKRGEDGGPPQTQATAAAGCHWGDARCKAKHVPLHPPEDGGVAGGVSLAGSATSKIKARLESERASKMKGDPALPSSSSSEHRHGPAPPEGFRLAASVVTSPHDGLSYFLDADGGEAQGEDEGRATLAGLYASIVPYAYVECGTSIESTTEAFPLTDVKVQHLPAGAGAGHFVNLSGGVTSISSVSGDNLPDGEEDGESSSRRWSLGGWDGDGRPQLLVALSPVELTVSGNGEESRTFGRGDVVLLEDVAGMGHRMRSGERGTDMEVMLVRLPHEVHLPVDLDSADGEGEELTEEGVLPADFDPARASARGSARSALFGFGPQDLHRGRRRKKKKNGRLSPDSHRPCPLDYDSAHATLFEPADVVPSRRRGRRRDRVDTFPWTDDGGQDVFDGYHPPPGHTTHGLSGHLPSIITSILPSLGRKVFLAGVGFTFSSFFVYVLGQEELGRVVLVLFGGLFVVGGGVVAGSLAGRWAYGEYLMDWEEEWMWRREVRRSRARVEEEAGEDEADDDDDASAEDFGTTPTAVAEEGESPDSSSFITPIDESVPEGGEGEALAGVK